MRIVVDLPEPFGPRKPVTVPGRTENDRSSTALVAPKCLLSERTSIIDNSLRRTDAAGRGHGRDIGRNPGSTLRPGGVGCPDRLGGARPLPKLRSPGVRDVEGRPAAVAHPVRRDPRRNGGLGGARARGAGERCRQARHLPDVDADLAARRRELAWLPTRTRSITASSATRPRADASVAGDHRPARAARPDGNDRPGAGRPHSRRRSRRSRPRTGHRSRRTDSPVSLSSAS